MKDVVRVFVEPSMVFDSLKRDTRFMTPLLLAIIGSSLLWVWYYARVDLAWLQDQMLGEVSGGGTADDDAARSFMGKGALTAIAVVASSIGYVALTAITALYFMAAGRLLQVRAPFSKWFSFAVWASVPGLLLLPIMAAQIVTGAAERATPEQLNVLSVNQLLLHLPTGHAWKSLADSFGITTVWCAVLMVVGLRRWSPAPPQRVVAAVMLPHAIVMGIWAAIIMMGSST